MPDGERIFLPVSYGGRYDQPAWHLHQVGADATDMTARDAADCRIPLVICEPISTA